MRSLEAQPALRSNAIQRGPPHSQARGQRLPIAYWKISLRGWRSTDACSACACGDAGAAVLACSHRLQPPLAASREVEGSSTVAMAHSSTRHAVLVRFPVPTDHPPQHWHRTPTWCVAKQRHCAAMVMGHVGAAKRLHAAMGAPMKRCTILGCSNKLDTSMLTVNNSQGPGA